MYKLLKFNRLHLLLLSIALASLLGAAPAAAETTPAIAAENAAVIVADTDAADTAESNAENAAEEGVSRPITQIYMLEAGGASALDTYLSPLRYHGASLALAGTWSKALPWMADSWLMRFDTRLAFERMLNPAQTAMELGFDFSFSWEAAWRHTFPSRLSVTAGASADIGAGALYLPRNSNNPASAKADIGISLAASASYPVRIGKLHVLISDHVKLPTLSAFFSPAFGEPYYEIYLGNHSGLVHAGWWGNHFGIDNLLTFDLDLGPSALRLGYRYHLQSSWVNHINTQLQQHSFVIGWIPHGIGLKPSKPKRKSMIINSLY